MNIITFGSCMAEGVFAALKGNNRSTNFQYLNHVIHNRSDYFVDTYVNSLQEPADYSDIVDADNFVNVDFPNLDLIEENKFYIDNQSQDKIGINRVKDRNSFFYNLHNNDIDIVIMDNFMDIAAKLVTDKVTQKKFFIHSGAYSSLKFAHRFEYTDFLRADDSFSNQLLIIKYLLAIQPNVEIYFSPFPRSVYSHENRDSVLRATDFRDLIDTSELGVKILSVPDVSELGLRQHDDWCHYKDEYYLSIAEQITIPKRNTDY